MRKPLMVKPSVAMAKVPLSGLEKWWRSTGPSLDPRINALDHLRRFNFEIDHEAIYPHPGFELSREDQMAVDYLVDEFGYEYCPPEQSQAVRPPLTGSRRPARAGDRGAGHKLALHPDGEDGDGHKDAPAD